MLLSDRSIRDALSSGRISINPWTRDNIQPASIDLTLSDDFLIEDEMAPWVMRRQRLDQVTLRQGQFILASTRETVELGNDIAARVEGKSSLGRQGLLAHITAGFIDPGFRGQITLELCNMARRPFLVTAGMKICQIGFLEMTSPVANAYGTPGLGSKYQDSVGTVAAKDEF
jgi:dCTP deaminase